MERLDNRSMTAYRENARDSLADLEDDDKRVLAQLVRLLVRADGELTGPEREHIGRIAGEAGNDDFWKLMDEAAASGDDAEQILKQAKGVSDRDAQEMIYGALYELSIQDATDASENDLLARLAELWEITIKEVP